MKCTIYLNCKGVLRQGKETINNLAKYCDKNRVLRQILWLKDNKRLLWLNNHKATNKLLIELKWLKLQESNRCIATIVTCSIPQYYGYYGTLSLPLPTLARALIPIQDCCTIAETVCEALCEEISQHCLSWYSVDVF